MVIELTDVPWDESLSNSTNVRFKSLGENIEKNVSSGFN